MKLTIQSILRAAFAPILFAMLAFSVNENAAAQTVGICPSNAIGFNAPGADPHAISGTDCDLPSTPSFFTTFHEGEGNIPRRCGQCLNDLTGTGITCEVYYQVEVGESHAQFCGPRSQCNAVGGTILSGNRGTPGDVCECNPGNARIGGVCVAGETEADCETFEEFANEDADRTEGVCRPRVAGDCDPNFEFSSAAVGGTCVECEDHEFSTNGAACTECDPNEFRGTEASCVACPIENEVRAQGETMCSCPDSTHYDNPAGTCDERIDSTCTGIQRYDRGTNTCIDCADNEIQSDSDAGSCVACPIDNEVRTGSETECSCPDATHYGDDTAMTCVERLTCPGNQRYNRSDNTCIDCAENEVQSDSDAGSCTACPPTQVRTGTATECSACPGFANTAEGTCDAIAECTAAQSRLVNNVCTECDRDQHLVNGACVACDANEVRAQNAAACTCPVFTDTDGSCIPFTVCADPLDLNEADNTCFCPQDTHFGDVASCVAHTDCTGEGANVIRNSDDNTCVCDDDFEGTPATSCTACAGEYVSENGADCACPEAESFDAGEGVCEINLEGTCADPFDTYNSQTNECNCPAGQRPNADETACEAIPASSDGGSSNGAVIALVAVPAVLIAGYWWLGGFEYISPAYGMEYSGENGNLDWNGNAGFNLRHGGLRSYANAVQSNGDAVSYESGISFEADNFALTYAATESQSDYDFDLGAEMGYNLGVMEIAPTAAASLQYRTGEETWNAETTAGVSAAWTAHHWVVRGRSDFVGDSGHALDLELRF